ncbi:four helix bundle protein [Anaerosolibacter sp.]|uniref:four helix bundle protein n=1 Tax=Anaerosolibacter sp. TaxID=1872527 RepID=UPI0039F0C7E9
MYKTFTEMPMWKQALGVSTRIFHMTDALPRKEDYGLTSQIRRSVNSIGANIAEGFGRKHIKEKIRFYYIARGSAYETMHHLLYGKEVAYFTKEDVDSIIDELERIALELNRIIKSLGDFV